MLTADIHSYLLPVSSIMCFTREKNNTPQELMTSVLLLLLLLGCCSFPPGYTCWAISISCYPWPNIYNPVAVMLRTCAAYLTIRLDTPCVSIMPWKTFQKHQLICLFTAWSQQAILILLQSWRDGSEQFYRKVQEELASLSGSKLRNIWNL